MSEKWYHKVVKKITKTASETAKVEVKETVKNSIPTIVAIGTIIFGIIAFKEPKAITNPIARMNPSVSTMKVITNNYFFGEEAKNDILNTIKKGASK